MIKTQSNERFCATAHGFAELMFNMLPRILLWTTNDKRQTILESWIHITTCPEFWPLTNHINLPDSGRYFSFFCKIFLSFFDILLIFGHQICLFCFSVACVSLIFHYFPHLEIIPSVISLTFFLERGSKRIQTWDYLMLQLESLIELSWALFYDADYK